MIQLDLFKIEGNLSIIINSFLTNDANIWKEMSDSFDQVGLDLVVSLNHNFLSTSVTGSLPPLSYLPRLGFYAHYLANWQAWKES